MSATEADPATATAERGRGGNRAVAGALAAGVALDLAAHAGGVGVALTVAALAPVAVLLGGGTRLPQRSARVLLGAAALFALWPALRTSPWLLAPDLLVGAGLVWLGASFARSGSPGELTVPGAVYRGIVAAGQLAAGVTVLRWRPARPLGGDRGAVLLRGLALAAPLVLVLGMLLASADVVFAHLFAVEVPSGAIVWHVVVVAAGAWAVGGLVRQAATAVSVPSPLQPALGGAEASVVLTCLVVLFGVFAAAQVWAVSSGGRRVIETEGLTYAEYARQGFFQLLAVAGITLAALLALRAVTDVTDPAGQRRFRRLALAAVGLTLVIVAVAFRRLWLYQQAYALTMLRLSAGVAIAWIGVVFVLLGATFTRWLPPRRFLAAAGVAALIVLVGLDVANPEAVVVRQNVARYEHSGRLDTAYLTGLSDDAVPALVAALPRLDPATAAAVRAGLCQRDRDTSRGPLGANLARSRAQRALRTACGGPLGPR